MSSRKLKKLVEAGFVPGIYNFCDRWCEKCSHKSNCISYVMGRKVEEKGGIGFNEDESREGKEDWEHLKNIFDSAYEVLNEVAKERGIDVNDIYAFENIEQDLWDMDCEESEEEDELDDLLVSSTDIIRICLIYEEIADECLELVFEMLDENSEGKDPDKKSETDEALDTVNWYFDIIQVKMRRALYGYHLYDASPKERKETNDYNGSAKVSLLAVDETIKAWQVIRKDCPGLQKNINQILVVLGQLVRDIEKQFPDARSFQRPGFDK